MKDLRTAEVKIAIFCLRTIFFEKNAHQIGDSPRVQILHFAPLRSRMTAQGVFTGYIHPSAPNHGKGKRRLPPSEREGDRVAVEGACVQ